MRKGKLRLVVTIVLLVVVAGAIGVSTRQVWLARQAERHPILIGQAVSNDEQAVGSLFGASVWKWTANTDLPKGTLKLWAEYYLHGEHQGIVTEVRELSFRGVPRGDAFYMGWAPSRERFQLSFQADGTTTWLNLQVERAGSGAVEGGCKNVRIAPGETSTLAIFVYDDESISFWPEGTDVNNPETWRDYVLKNDHVYALKIQLEVHERKHDTSQSVRPPGWFNRKWEGCA